MLSLSIFHVSAKIIHNGPYFIRGEREGGCEFLGLSRQSFKSFDITINIRINSHYPINIIFGIFF